MANTTLKVTDIDESGNVIERDMTSDELAQKKADVQRVEALATEIAAKEALRQSRREKLLALGLTEEELDA